MRAEIGAVEPWRPVRGGRAPDRRAGRHDRHAMSLRPTTLDQAELQKHPLPEVTEGTKDDHGRLMLVGGSRTTPGSAAIAATAAMRSGCGKVTIATVESMAPHVALAVPEALVLGLAETRDGAFARSAVRTVAERAPEFDAVVAGPGMRQSKLC